MQLRFKFSFQNTHYDKNDNLMMMIVKTSTDLRGATESDRVDGKGIGEGGGRFFFGGGLNRQGYVNVHF